MNINNFLQKLNSAPNSIEFNDTMAVIEALYDFTPTSFKNGELLNEAGKNSGSCKLFAFAQLQQFSPQQTLACFGAYYRDDTLKNPLGTDHQNIRIFQKTAWSGIIFDSNPLTPKVG